MEKRTRSQIKSKRECSPEDVVGTSDRNKLLEIRIKEGKEKLMKALVYCRPRVILNISDQLQEFREGNPSSEIIAQISNKAQAMGQREDSLEHQLETLDGISTQVQLILEKLDDLLAENKNTLKKILEEYIGTLTGPQESALKHKLEEEIQALTESIHADEAAEQEFDPRY